MEGFISSGRIRRANAFVVRNSVPRPRAGYPRFCGLYGGGELVATRRKGLLITGPFGGKVLACNIVFGGPRR